MNTRRGNGGGPVRGEGRRSLSHVGGESETWGDEVCARELAHALDVPPSTEAEDEARAHVHGFHAYPARMHPVTARRLIEAFSQEGDAVLDPFCGSGTALVEARLLGRVAIGVDANPLAVRLAKSKVFAASARYREALLAAAREVGAVADTRRKARLGASRRYGPEDVALFEPHVLLELDGLRVGIDAVADPTVRGDLELVLSAILTKVSRRASDTSAHEAPRRLGAGYPAKLFVRKTEELVRRLEEVAADLHAGPEPMVFEGDARELEGIEDGSIALAVTSPPYPGVYDYVDHHADRLRWLRLEAKSFEAREVGAKRRIQPLGPEEAVRRWRSEVHAWMRTLGRVLERDGLAAVLIADSVVQRTPIYADELLADVGAELGLEVLAVASQPRPHFHAPTARAFARRPRREHAVLLRHARRRGQ